MKKFSLLVMLVAFSVVTVGQNRIANPKSTDGLNTGKVQTGRLDRPNMAKHATEPVKKALADLPILWQNDFSNAANWTLSNEAGGNFTIGTTFTDCDYWPGVITSTTASNGFALLNSDCICATSIKAHCKTAQAIDCSAATTGVTLQFETFWRKYEDHVYVRVSNNNGSTWTTYDLAINSLTRNASTANPETVIVDISATAAGQSAVLIDFYYEGACDYAWMIDDVKVFNGVIAQPPVIDKVLTYGGIMSGTKDTIYLAEPQSYFLMSNVSYATSSQWAVTSPAEILNQSTDGTDAEVAFNSTGPVTATLTATGSTSVQNTVSIATDEPFGYTDWVINALPTDASIWYVNPANNNYSSYGLNASYKVIGETYTMYKTTPVQVNAIEIGYLLYSIADKTATFPITFIAYDPTTGYLGDTIARFTPTVADIFGNTNVTSATQIRYADYTLPQAVNINGSFMIAYDFSNLGTPSATNYFAWLYLGGTNRSPIGFTTNYCIYNGAWTNIVSGGSSMFAYLNCTFGSNPDISLTPVTYSPAQDATDVALDATISVTFENAIAAGANIGAITVNGTTVTGTVSGSTLTVPYTLVKNTTYTVQVPAGAVTAATSGTVGNDAFSWSFTTVDIPDEVIVPVSYTPANGATDVAMSTVLYVEFDKDIEHNGPADLTQHPETGIRVLRVGESPAFNYMALNGASIDPENPKRLKITGNWSEGRATFAVTIPQTAIQGLQSDVTWSFKSKPYELFIVANSQNPYPDATGVLTSGATVSFKLNKANTTAPFGFTVDYNKITIKDDEGNSIPVTGISGGTGGIFGVNPWTIAHGDFRYARHYTVTLAEDAVPDTTSGQLSAALSDRSWSFTTKDPETIARDFVIPANDGVDVSTTNEISITFDKNVNTNEAPFIDARPVVYIDDNPNDTVAVTGLTVEGKKITLTHAELPAFKKKITVKVPKAAVTGLAADEVWSFNTVPGTFTVSDLQPADNATEQTLNASVKFTVSPNLTYANPATDYSGVTIKDADGNAVSGINVSGGSSLANGVITIIHSAFEMGKTYTVTVPQNVFSGSGSLSAPVTWKFSTVEPAPVAPQTYKPAQGATEVEIDAEVSILFDVTVSTNAAPDFTGDKKPSIFKTSDPSTTYEVTNVTVTAASRKVTLEHAALPFDTELTAKIPQAAILGLAADVVWSFATVKGEAIDVRTTGGIYVMQSGDNLLVNGAKFNDVVTVYNIAGVKTVATVAKSIPVSKLGKGIWVVEVAGTMHKVVIK